MTMCFVGLMMLRSSFSSEAKLVEDPTGFTHCKSFVLEMAIELTRVCFCMQRLSRSYTVRYLIL